MKSKTQKIVIAALIAAVYASLTISLAFISYGEIQFRVAEALTILPFFSSLSIPGLFIGCVIANLLSPIGPLDIAVGSFATLIAAIITYYIGKSNLKFKKYIAPLPAVLVNAVVIGLLVAYTANIPFVLTALQVGFGELVCTYVLGLPLLLFIDKNIKIKRYLQ